MDMFHDGVKLIGVEAPVIGTVLVVARILSPIAHTVGLFLCFFLPLAAKSVTLNNVTQIANNRCAAYGLGMESGNNAGDLFIFFVCIFMI